MDRYTSDVIYASTDGLISIFSIIGAVAGSGLPAHTIIVMGMAALIADAFSLCASSYFAAESEINNKKNPKLIAFITFLSFIIIGLIPLFPFIYAYYFTINQQTMFNISYIITAFSLFMIGIFKSIHLNQSIIRGGIETLTIGGLAAIIAYLIGCCFNI